MTRAVGKIGARSSCWMLLGDIGGLDWTCGDWARCPIGTTRAARCRCSHVSEL